MAEYKIIKLSNISPLHIGTGTENYYTSATELQSDSVASALVAVGIQTGIIKSDESLDFLNSFKISSAFPYCGNNFYLPVSGGKIQLDNPDYEKKHRKELKDLKFLEVEDYFPDWAAGKKLKVKAVAENKATKGKQIAVSQRVTIRDNMATPFFFEWNFYNHNCGLYFIIDCEKTVFDKIFNLFKILGEFGIGTDKNVGGGKFVPIDSEIELPDVKNPDATMVLSSYIPMKDEMSKLNLNDSNYKLIKRGGFIAGSDNEDFRHLRKKPIYMFSAGSVFATTESIVGKTENLAPHFKEMHPVYRSGRVLTLKIKMQQQ
jgi:CRISPR type III-A-associated RAMP protein Csm4